jgi:hypothetical protein
MQREHAAPTPCLASLPNATTSARHLTLRRAMLSAGLSSQPSSSETRPVLVLNTIDEHYVDLIGAWKAMVLKAPFPKSLFVVAMDKAAADACLAASLAHFSPLEEHSGERGEERCAGETTDVGLGRGRGDAVAPAKPGSYHRTKIQGKEGDTRVLPPDLPSWKMHAVWAGLSLGHKVLFSESDVLWVRGERLPAQLFPGGGVDFDFAPQRHPMTPVWNFGFFYASGPKATSFFECGVRKWERKQLLARRATSRAVDIGSDQRFLWDLWRQRGCGSLRVRKLPLGLYPTCRDWISPGRSSEVLIVHITYCHRLSMKLSSEDVCKKKMMESFYLRGGIDVQNLTSAAWNEQMGC